MYEYICNVPNINNCINKNKIFIFYFSLILHYWIDFVYFYFTQRYRPVYFEDYEKIGYKHTLATFYSKACFWWLTPLLWFGYKEPLELEDLGQLRVEDSARAYYDQFLLTYKTAKLVSRFVLTSLIDFMVIIKKK